MQQPVTHAAIDWAAATAALDAGILPCSGGERRILRLATSLAAGLPVDLRDAITGLDKRKPALAIKAFMHASGQRPPRIMIAASSEKVQDLACCGETDPRLPAAAENRGYLALGRCISAAWSMIAALPQAP